MTKKRKRGGRALYLRAVEQVQAAAVRATAARVPHAARRGSGSARRCRSAPCASRRAPRCGRAGARCRGRSCAETVTTGGRWRRRASMRGRTSSIPISRDVPLREHDDRRALRLARDVGDGQVLVDEALAARRPGRARRRPARRRRARAAPSSTRFPAAACACAAARRCRRGRRCARRAARTVSIASRVVPGTSETITRSSPSSAFRRLDLPTFGRPRIATRIASSPTSCGPLPGSMRDDRVEQVARAVAVQRRERDRVAEAEPVELERARVLPRVVDLVREQEHRLAGAAQDLGQLLVARRDPRARVDDEQDEVGLGDRRPRLLDDRARDRRSGRRCRRRPCRSAGSGGRPLADHLLAVARHARRLVDDGGPRLRSAG